MDAVSNLVFNSLAQYEGIRLPAIGSLSVVRIPALINEQGKIIPPNNKVVYLKEEPENFTSIVDLIEHAIGDKEKAEYIYNKWVYKIRDEEGGISIEKTGGIKHDIFTVYPELDAILNPALGYATATPEMPVSPGPVPAEPELTKPMLAEPVPAASVSEKPLPAKLESTKVKVNTNTVMIWIIVGVLLGAAIVFGLLYQRAQNHKSYQWKSHVATTATVPDRNAVPSTPSQTPSPTTQTPSPADTVRQGSSPASAVPPADKALQGQQAQGLQTPNNATASALAKGQTVYYVVAGVFSVDRNAERFIAQSKAKGSTVQFAKIPWKGKVIVSAYTSSSRSEAEQMRKKLTSEFGELWVHQENGR